MPKKTPEYLVYFLQDCLQNNPSITYKSMFGGYGIYKQGKIFALYFSAGEIYFKVDENNKQDYIDAGSEPFRYTSKGGKVGVMCYYLLPEEIIENREILEIWVEKSLAVEGTKKKKTVKNIELDKQILEYLCSIPKGKITSYKYLADLFGVHPRKIASVMRYNKDPITYPCYKVLAESGKISGYNTTRGVDEKIEKLEADGIKIVNGKVDRKYFL